MDSFRNLRLRLEPEIASHCEAYHLSLRANGIGGTRQDTLRELLRIALSGEPMKAAQMSDRERALNLCIRQYLSQMRQYFAEKQAELGQVERAEIQGRSQ